MSRRDARWIADWRPDDDAFWEEKGRVIARRNLLWSIVAEHIGFSVWLIWSIVTTKLPQVGFHYTTAQLFQLVALPGLIGSFMRFPYTFAVPRFGGRNWTIVSAALLLIPTTLLAFFVTQPQTPFPLMLAVAATAGLGGGNFLPRSFSHRSNLLRRTKIDLLPRNRAAVAKSSGPLPAVFLACSLGTRLADCCFAPASQALAGDRGGAAPTAGRLTTGG